MSDDLIRRLTPEQVELERKQAELTVLEGELSQRELDLTTLHAELHAFERKYQQLIGIRYSELDRLEEQIQEYTAYLESSRDFNPSENIKKLYRELAKRIHPDLAIDEAERLRRQELMAEANQAYEDGDEERLKNILYSWESDPIAVKGTDIGSELIRVLRKISQSGDRLKLVEEELLAIQRTELYQLRRQVAQTETQGRDLLEEMVIQLDEQITSAKQQLEEVKAKLNNDG